MRVNAWLFSPTLIADPGTVANPRYEKGLMHITDMIPTLVRPQCSAAYYQIFIGNFALTSVIVLPYGCAVSYTRL